MIRVLAAVDVNISSVVVKTINTKKQEIVDRKNRGQI